MFRNLQLQLNSDAASFGYNLRLDLPVATSAAIMVLAPGQPSQDSSATAGAVPVRTRATSDQSAQHALARRRARTRRAVVVAAVVAAAICGARVAAAAVAVVVAAGTAVAGAGAATVATATAAAERAAARRGTTAKTKCVHREESFDG